NRCLFLPVGREGVRNRAEGVRGRRPQSDLTEGGESMKSKGLFHVLGATALAVAMGGNAFALSGVLCPVGGGADGDGVAVIGPGFNSGTTAGIPFEFTARCSSGPVTGCAVGSLDNNQCAFGEHRGAFAYCAGGCSVTCTDGTLSGQPCTGDNV